MRLHFTAILAALIAASTANADISGVEGPIQTMTGPYQYTRLFRFTVTTPIAIECLRNDGVGQPGLVKETLDHHRGRLRYILCDVELAPQSELDAAGIIAIVGEGRGQIVLDPFDVSGVPAGLAFHVIPQLYGDYLVQAPFPGKLKSIAVQLNIEGDADRISAADLRDALAGSALQPSTTATLSLYRDETPRDPNASDPGIGFCYPNPCEGGGSVGGGSVGGASVGGG